MTNFQDVLRDVHDPSLHALKTTASLSASTVYVGNPTLYAVVNTGAASDPKTFIGLTTTVIGGGATIFAVVNTAAAGQSSVVLDRGHEFVGLATVVQSSTTRTLVGNVTIDSIGSTVNTALSGNVTIDSGTVSLTGNLTLSDAKTFVGLVSVSGFTNPLPVDATGQGDVPVTLAGETVVLAGGTNQIGSVTIPHVVSTTFSGNVTIDSGTVSISSLPALTVGSATIGIVRQASSARTITGNVTLSDSRTYIGLVTARPVGLTTVIQTGNTTVVQASAIRSIAGNITINSGTITAVTDITNPIAIKGNLTLSDAKTFIGLVTVGNTVTVDATGSGDVPITLAGEQVVLGTGANLVGIVTVANPSSFTGNVTLDAGSRTGILGNITLSDAKTFVGLVTAESLNAGTTKTLIPQNFSFAQASVTTIAVPTGGNAIFNMTSLIANSNATVGLRVKSGATYLIGNVTLSVMLNPGGGWVQHGSPDSPVYKGLASGAAIVVEKEDFGQVAEIAGHLIYYQE